MVLTRKGKVIVMAKIDSLSEIDEYYEQKEFERKMNHFPSKMVIIGIIVLISLLLGVGVYFIVNALMAEPKEEVVDEFIGEQMDLNDENVKVLYQYVTYGTEDTRNTKFVMNREVTIGSFTNEEKLYYALQFVQVEDFSFTGKYTEEKEKIYRIPLKKIEDYMELYFGPEVKYQPEKEITYPFTFYINKMNVGELKYNMTQKAYDATFTTSTEETRNQLEIPPVYGKLISALRRADGSVILQERVVYTELRTDNGLYAVDIYKDPEHQELLDSKVQLQLEDLKKLKIDVADYPSTAIVQYTFAVNGGTLYFESSNIII